MSRLALGIDIGGTKILVGLVDEAGNITAQRRVATPAMEGGAAVLQTVIAAGRDVLAQSDARPIGCGVGTAGVVDKAGTIVSATDTLPGWAGIRLADRLSEAFDLRSVVVNDVHAVGICEARLGAARGYDSALIVALGTGIGGAIVRNGELDPGATGIAGSVGHILSPLRRGAVCSCGAVDHIEAHASGPAIEAEFAARTGRRLELRTIAALDDAVAVQVIAEAGEALGASIGTAVNLLDCNAVVVGGGVAEIGEPLMRAIAAGLARQVLPPARDVAVKRAQHRTNSCLVGGALAALDLA